MNENLNIAEILKAVGAKEGYPLYSMATGDVKLVRIQEEDDDLIIVKTGREIADTYSENGRWSDVGECLLFPSKDNRDWSTVKPEKPECSFKPYDRVLVRDRDDSEWMCDFFSHYRSSCGYDYMTISGGYKFCISYEGNEHLVGTTDSPNE